MPEGERTSEMVASAHQRTVWQIDPKHTAVELAVSYLTFTTVKGRFERVSGTIRGDEADPARASVDVEIDAASLDTGEGRRDVTTLIDGVSARLTTDELAGLNKQVGVDKQDPRTVAAAWLKGKGLVE
jgi:polyisoprenoid-binding protein YceI